MCFVGIFMFGRVNGPYKGNFNNDFVAITLYNKDGSFKSRTNLSYKRYLKEFDEGLHNYITPPIKGQYKPVKTKNIDKIENYRNCFYCEKTFLPTYNNKVTERYFCSQSCLNKHKRREKRKSIFDPIYYYNQVVIRIKGTENENYLIVYNKQPGNRETYFIESSKTITELTDDSNSIPRLHLKFDLKDTVRVRLVPGYKKLFWVTETGILISRRTRKVLAQTLSKTGYWTHASMIGGRKGQAICLKIHRCVGWAFIPNPDNKPFINHKDGVKTNNRYTNLEWVTNQENIDHAWATGLAIPLQGEAVGGSKLTNEEAGQLRDLHWNQKYSIAKIARMYNIHRATASRCIKYKRYKIIE